METRLRSTRSSARRLDGSGLGSEAREPARAGDVDVGWLVRDDRVRAEAITRNGAGDHGGRLVGELDGARPVVDSNMHGYASS
jgi:hypothetical protein